MNKGFFGERGLFLDSGKFLLLFGEGLTGFSKRLCLLVGLGGQGVQPFLLPLDFELGDGQVLFGTAALTAFYIRVPGSAHKIEEVVLQDAVRLLQDRLAVLLQNRLSRFVQQRFGCPLLAPADLHDGLLDCADQSLVLAAFRPEDLLFHHRHIDHMEVVVVDLPAQSFGHGTVDLIRVHDGGEDILLTANDLDSSFVGIIIELLGELIAAVIVEIGRVNIENKLAVVGGIRLQAARGNGSSGFQLGK